MTHAPPVAVGTELRIADFVEVARRGRRATLAPSAAPLVHASRAAVERILNAGDQAPHVYGVNTGFGALSETRISAGDILKLQLNLVRSHCTGVGTDLSRDAVRGMLLLRAQTLALGHSGVRAIVIETLLQMLAADLLPRVPSQGSVGASGDLAPLAHLALGAIGEGEATLAGERMPAAQAFQRAGLTPLTLQTKEGLALINGTQFMTALGALSLFDADRISGAADIAAALSVDALKGSSRPFDARLMALRRHPGQAQVAENLRNYLGGSEIMESHRDCDKVQDPYSLRCVPQVHGASRDALGFGRNVLEREINSVTDNPSVFVDGEEADIISGGNFHGQPVALALDLAAIALAELGNISERRVEQLVNPALSSGLTPFLAKHSGLESGLMIAQVASASLVSENKVLCHPASVDSIPSSAGKEDHVSMGSISARKLTQIVDNVRRSIAIELLTAAEGLEQRRPLTGGRGVEAAHAAIRSVVPALDQDRPLYENIEALAELIADGRLEAAVAEACG